uniref:ATP synthase F0 subunit 8 n=1 Tax=Rhipicentor nuttalli TaxID=72856 RepID=A0A3G2JZU9_9ACAR|nr:ATP synthase F0 subunit 8 [Rhipicentor nuttalli]AYN50575.1 ATP synthase F0 subunit 8 [Rhipicentor nuttalli]
MFPMNWILLSIMILMLVIFSMTNLFFLNLKKKKLINKINNKFFAKELKW